MSYSYNMKDKIIYNISRKGKNSTRFNFIKRVVTEKYLCLTLLYF